MYLISTKEFGLTETDIHILRGSGGMKKIAFKEIEYIHLTYGSLVKNRIGTTIFGVLFVIISVFLIYDFLKIHEFQLTNFVHSRKTGPAGFVIVFCTSFIGFWSLYQVLKSRMILSIRAFDGFSENFKLEEIVNDQRLPELVRLLSLYFTPDQFRLNKKLKTRYPWL